MFESNWCDSDSGGGLNKLWPLREKLRRDSLQRPRAGGASLAALIALFTASLLHLPLPLQLRVVKPAGVAERPGAVGTTSPLGGVDTVAAVASAWRCGALIRGKTLAKMLVIKKIFG